MNTFAAGVLTTLGILVLVAAVIRFQLWWYPYAVVFVVGNRLSWYSMRKEQGHPISLKRALFGKIPRFGIYERHEAGCPAHDLRDYATVEGEMT